MARHPVEVSIKGPRVTAAQSFADANSEGERMTAKKQIAHAAVPLPVSTQRVMRLLSRILPPSDYRNCVEPHFADLHRQYTEAWRTGHPWLARWFVLRTWIRVLWPVIKLVLLIIWRD